MGSFTFRPGQATDCHTGPEQVPSPGSQAFSHKERSPGSSLTHLIFGVEQGGREVAGEASLGSLKSQPQVGISSASP